MSQEHLLVVGGTGFIGKNLVITALKKGYKVSVVSLTDTNDSDKVGEVEYQSVNIVSSDSVKAYFTNKNFDYIVNLGGYVNHSRYFMGGSDVYDVHSKGLQNIVQFVHRERLKGFVQIGSSDEYGNLPAPQKETLRENPISPYSLAKLASAQLLQMLYTVESFPAVILRLFLVYGPDQDTNRFLPQIIYGCIKNEKFPTSKGDQIRDFCYIDDVVNAIFIAMKTPGCLGEIINIASGVPIKIKEIIKSTKEIIGKGQPQFGIIKYRQGENMSLYADVTKAKMILDWDAEVSLKNGLNKTIEFYKKGYSL